MYTTPASACVIESFCCACALGAKDAVRKQFWSQALSRVHGPATDESRRFIARRSFKNTFWMKVSLQQWQNNLYRQGCFTTAAANICKKCHPRFSRMQPWFRFIWSSCKGRIQCCHEQRCALQLFRIQSVWPARFGVVILELPGQKFCHVGGTLQCGF